MRTSSAQQTTEVGDYLNNNFSGINASESAGNPFQLDIYYHGFTASPLLGTPEGLSVYVDGVRVNESFGDTVNWDLIPESAINTVSLISGSNPVFGLNTLGGALSIQTKSGHANPGTEIEAYGGSFGRRSVQAETGGEFGAFDYFFTGNYFDENGWRDVSSTRVWQGFGKVGWQTDSTDIDLSYTYADTSLYGDGSTPMSMLYYRREQTYTPDFTQNLMSFVNLTGTQSLGEHLLLTGNAFYRYLNTFVSNGNINDSYLEDNYAGPPTDCTDPGANAATLAYCIAGAGCHLDSDPAHPVDSGCSSPIQAMCLAGRTRRSSVPTTPTRRILLPRPNQFGGVASRPSPDVRRQPLQQPDGHLARRQQQDLRPLLHRYHLAERSVPYHRGCCATTTTLKRSMATRSIPIRPTTVTGSVRQLRSVVTTHSPASIRPSV